MVMHTSMVSDAVLTPEQQRDEWLSRIQQQHAGAVIWPNLFVNVELIPGYKFVHSVRYPDIYSEQIVSVEKLDNGTWVVRVKCYDCGDVVTRDDDDDEDDAPLPVLYRTPRGFWVGECCVVYCGECDLSVISNSDEYCERCVELCIDCGYGYLPRDMYLTVANVSVCEDCVSFCPVCDEPQSREEPCHHVNRRGMIHNYSYTPELNFRHHNVSNGWFGPIAHGLYIGIEHELEAHGDVSKLVEVVKGFDEEESLFYCKEDGSLSNGVEIVSHPMTPDWFFRNYPFEMLRQLSDAHAVQNSHTGIHIHLSADAFTTYHLYKFLHLHHQWKTLISRVADRESSYARPDANMTEEMKVLYAQKKNRNYDRYVWVNLQNSDTIELRYFRSTLNPKRLRGYVEWVDGIYRYTDIAKVRAKSKDVEVMSPEGLRRFLRQEPDRYKHILEMLNNRHDVFDGAYKN